MDTLKSFYGICDICIPKLRDAEQFRRQVVTCEDQFLQFYNEYLFKGNNFMIPLFNGSLLYSGDIMYDYWVFEKFKNSFYFEFI